MSHRLGAVVASSLCAALLLPACGSSTPKRKLPVLTIWSSFPKRGPQGRQAKLLDRAIRGALWDLRGRTDDYQLRYVALDSSNADGSGWDPGLAAANARRASLDPTTVAFIGDLDSGATAVELPITNQAGILQISPTATAEGLTGGGVGAGPGAPYQYYPSGRRSFARLVPRDSMQGALIAQMAQGASCAVLAVIDDGSIYGAGLAQIIASQAPPRGVGVSFTGTLDPRQSAYRAAVHSIKADCIVYAGAPNRSAVRAVTDAARANPAARVFGSDALVSPRFADPRHGGISKGLAKRTTLVGTFAGESAYPPHGQWLWRNLLTRNGTIAGQGVISAYAAAELVISCQDQAGLKGGLPRRDALLACALGHNHYSRALGPYRVLLRGDSTVHAYSQLRISDGSIKRVGPLYPPRPIKAPASG